MNVRRKWGLILTCLNATTIVLLRVFSLIKKKKPTSGWRASLKNVFAQVPLCYVYHDWRRGYQRWHRPLKRATTVHKTEIGDATTTFPAKWRLRNKRRNSIGESKFSTNQKHCADQDSGTPSVWSFLRLFLRRSLAGNCWWRSKMLAIFLG